MQVPEKLRGNPEHLGSYYVRSVTGDMVPLSAVVSVSTNASPAAIEQFNQLNSATISALPVPGVTTGDGLQTIEDIARPLLPAGFFIDYSGQSRPRKEQGNTIAIAFVLAVVVIYLRARRPVRKLPRSAHHHDVGAAVDLRRAPAAQPRPGA